MGIAKSFDVVPVSAFAAGKKLEQAEHGETESGGQLPFRDRGACAIAGERASCAQTTIRGQPVFATDGIEDAVHAARGELRDAAGEIFGTIIDGSCA